MKILKRPKGLLPVQIKNMGKFTVEDGNIVERCSIIAKDGTIICQGISEERAEYLEKLINMKELEYDVVRRAINQDRDKLRIVAEFKLPKQPIQRRNSRTVTERGDGVFTFEPTREYSDRRRDLFKIIAPSVKKYRSKYPIKTLVEVEFVFYINKGKGDKYSLIELIATALEHMKDLRIIKDDTDKIISSTNNSRICYTEQEPYTHIIIKKVE